MVLLRVIVHVKPRSPTSPASQPAHIKVASVWSEKWGCGVELKYYERYVPCAVPYRRRLLGYKIYYGFVPYRSAVIPFALDYRGSRHITVVCHLRFGFGKSGTRYTCIFLAAPLPWPDRGNSYMCRLAGQGGVAKGTLLH